MKQIPIKWIYLIALAIVWGSTFILMKKALIGIEPYQLGALRIVFTTIFLLCFGYKTMRYIYKTQ